MNALTPFRIDAGLPAGSLSVELVLGPAALWLLEPEWTALFARCGRPGQVFQTMGFLAAWIEAYTDETDSLAVVTIRQDGRLAGALPIVRTRRFGVDIARVMGAPVAQFDDMLLDPAVADRALPLVRREIEALGVDLLELRRLREDGALWPLEAEGAIRFEADAAPFADLSRRVAGGEPGEAYPSKDRSNLRRRIKRLCERGAVAFKVCRAGEDEAVALAARAVDLKKLALERDGVFSRAVGCSRFETFFRLAAADPASGMMISTIELDGRAIGVDLSFLCKGTGFGHVLATEGDFDKEGLGQMLVHHVFAAAAKAGATRFDLLAPADPYKLRHADGQTRVESRVYTFTPRGRAAAALLYRWGLPMARRLAGALPAGITRTIAAGAGV